MTQPMFAAVSRRDWLRSASCGFGSLALANLLTRGARSCRVAPVNHSPLRAEGKAIHLHLPPGCAVAP